MICEALVDATGIHPQYVPCVCYKASGTRGNHSTLWDVEGGI